MEKLDARTLSPSAQEALRKIAVKAVVDGAKQCEVAKTFGVSRLLAVEPRRRIRDFADRN